MGSGLINYTYGLCGIAGGYLDSALAIKKGENFVRYALMLFMLASGIWLVATA